MGSETEIFLSLIHIYTLNGAHPDLSVDQQYLEEGDVIVFHYTDDYTKEDWNSGVTVSEVIKMIDALPAAEDLDLSYAAAVAEAQDAFNALSDEDVYKRQRYSDMRSSHR